MRFGPILAAAMLSCRRCSWTTRGWRSGWSWRRCRRLGLLGKALREKGEVRTAAARDGSCPSCGGEKLVVCAHCDGSMRILMRDKARGVDVERRCPWCNEVGMQECADCPR